MLTARASDSRPDDAHIRAGLTEAARHSMCQFLLFAIAYFLFNTLFYRIAGDPGLIPGLSLLTLTACVGFWFCNRTVASSLRLEITGHVLGLLFIANALLDIFLQYRSIKLMYLLLLLPAFAVSGVRPRVVVVTSLAAVAGFLWAAYSFERPQLVDCAWVAATGLFIGVGLSTVIRASMTKAVRARLSADRHRDEALSLATFDPLTGLANRRAFLKTLDARLMKGDGFFLGLADLDGFKPINDIYGHAAGDQVLIEVARRLRDTCGPDAVIARLGGDEFAILLSDIADTAAWQSRADALCDALSAPYAIGHETAHLSASLGFTHRVPDTPETPSKLLERADYALYEAKERGRGIAILFDGTHEALIRSTQAVEQALRNIDSDRELTLAFQPQYDIVDNRTVAFEALARWHNDKLGQVPPDVFIRAAERSGLITRLTPILLDKALSAARTWPPHMRLAFNLSARDLLSPVAMNRIVEVVEASGVAPARIEFEITETVMLNDFTQAHRGISRLRDLGCRMALDDFGSGYTNFSYINRVRVDTVKIDRSFVVELSHSDTSKKIIKSMIELAANLGMDHIIEGVETVDELRQLRAAGAVHVQGYLFGKPMAPTAIAAFLREEQERGLIETLKSV
ncbi:EAL domain-containing protein [Asticcacaulis sp. BYS171W]|uniref:EAL domain-containing protein n=1 Tax=Asticcacaulis aquaticus TaxID=2984212 RepID=A0ABT5HUH6_9CAUL|nr:EAL domain-containing protein [Asticcacaulis aquaticus]MDC7683603.1 EAL domain-containing protein [Asticcacaulis aquaticus]